MSTVADREGSGPAPAAGGDLDVWFWLVRSLRHLVLLASPDVGAMAHVSTEARGALVDAVGLVLDGRALRDAIPGT